MLESSSQDGETGSIRSWNSVFAIRENSEAQHFELSPQPELQIRTRFGVIARDCGVQSSSGNAPAVVLHVSLHGDGDGGVR